MPTVFTRTAASMAIEKYFFMALNLSCAVACVVLLSVVDDLGIFASLFAVVFFSYSCCS